MAFPLALLGLALGVGGAAMQYRGAKRAADASQNVWNSFRDRNRLREQEAANVWNQSLAKSGADTASEDMRAGEQKRLGNYDRMASIRSASPLPTTSTGNRMIATPTSGSRAAVKNAGSAWSKLLGGAQAKVGSLQDWQVKQNERTGGTERELNRISRNARGDLNNVVPAELNAAARKGDSLKGWGSLVQSVGALAGTASAFQTAPSFAGRVSTFQENPALGNVWSMPK